GGPARDAGDLAAVVPSAWADRDDRRRARNIFLTVTVTVTEPSRKRMKPGEQRAVDRGDELIGNRAELVGDADRAGVLGVDQRDQALDASLRIGPLAHRARRLGRESLAPVRACECP